MTFETLLPILASYSEHQTTPEPHRLDVVIAAEQLVETVTQLQAKQWGYLMGITALDSGTSLELLYHFCEGPAVLTLRVNLTYDAPHIPTIMTVIPSARLYEQEVKEMFGVQVVGLPDVGFLFLPDDWKPDVYPLRKGGLA